MIHVGLDPDMLATLTRAVGAGMSRGGTSVAVRRALLEAAARLCS